MGAPHPPVARHPPGAAAGDEPAPRPLPGDADGGAARWLWHSRFGTMLIEVVGGDVFVNGQRVQHHAPCPAEDADGRDRRYAVQRRS